VKDALLIEFTAVANSAIRNSGEGSSDFVRGELGHLDTPSGVGTGEVKVWVGPRSANKVAAFKESSKQESGG
jgi:hypothetical protein